jgi:phage terminase Nu1 subunit (DNA packaging protein)
VPELESEDWLEGGVPDSEPAGGEPEAESEAPAGGEPTRGEIFTKNRLAKVIGIAAVTIDKWIREGCPVIARGSRKVAWQLNSADVINWARKRDVLQLAIGDEEAASFDTARRRTSRVEIARGPMMAVHEPGVKTLRLTRQGLGQ